MTADDLQQALDTLGHAEAPPGTHYLDKPVFLDRPDRTLVGLSSTASKLNSYWGGTALVAGFRRGLVSDDHFPNNAFRTRADCHLISHGTEFALGPTDHTGVKGWGSLPSLTVRFTGESHGAGWRYDPGTGELFETVLAGVTGYYYTAQLVPEPYVLWWTNRGQLRLSLRGDDGATHHLDIAADHTNPHLSLTVSVDLDAGTATACVNGLPAAVAGAVPPGTRLMDNHRWPWALMRGEAFCNSSGLTPGGGRVDATVTRFEVESGEWKCFLNLTPTGGRVGTYPGGPGLPLLRAWSTNGVRSVLVVRQDQGVPDSVGGVTVRDLGFDGGTSVNPLILLAGIQGGLTLRDCRLTNGSRGVSSLALAVQYPLRLADLDFLGQSDCCLWLHGATLRLTDAQFRYGVRRSAFLSHCHGAVEYGLTFPGGPPKQDAIFEQWGGDLEYVYPGADYEYAPAPPAAIDLYPVVWEPAFPVTRAEVRRWRPSSTVPTAVRVLDPGSQPGPHEVVVDGPDVPPEP